MNKNKCQQYLITQKFVASFPATGLNIRLKWSDYIHYIQWTVNSYAAELGIAMEKMLSHFRKKFDSSFHISLHCSSPYSSPAIKGTPYIHVQCMPIRVLGRTNHCLVLTCIHASSPKLLCQWLHSCLLGFSRYFLYIASSLTCIKETLLRSERVERDESSQNTVCNGAVYCKHQ